MKIIPRRIANAVYVHTTPGKSYGVYLEGLNDKNRLLVGSPKVDCEPEVFKDLINKYAYASALLYFVENFEVENDINKNDLLEDINVLLHSRCRIVNEKAPILTEIGNYPIYEGTNYVLRGDGENKIKESFDLTEDISIDDIDLEYIKNHEYDDIIKDFVVCPKCKNVFESDVISVDYDEIGNEVSYSCPYCNHTSRDEETFSDAWVGDLEDAPNADEMVPGLRQLIDTLEEDAGTQTSDIASKVDYNFQSDITSAKMKYEAVEVKELDESTHLNLTGFMKDIDGLYKRGNYVLVKESATGELKVIHKSKLKEAEVAQVSVKGGDFVSKVLETRLDEKFPDRFRVKGGPVDDENYGLVITDNDNHSTGDLIDVTDFINAVMANLKYDKSDYEIDYKGNKLVMAIYNNKTVNSTDF